MEVSGAGSGLLLTALAFLFLLLNGFFVATECSADSVGGLVLHRLGDLPKERQQIPFEGFRVVVRKTNGSRIVLARVYPERCEEAPH